jgi:hypothetical protein
MLNSEFCFLKTVNYPVVSVNYSETQMTQEKPATMQSKANKKMPVFTCSCGAKILIVPDLREMTKAIKAHELEHRMLTGKRMSEEAIAEQIIMVLGEHFRGSVA